MNSGHIDTTPAGPGGEDLHAALTALALGELEGDERTEAEQRLADPAALDARRHVEAMRIVADALQFGRSDDPAVTPSPDLRRAVVAAAAGSPTRPAGSKPAGPPVRGRYPRWLLAGGGMAAAVAIAFVVSSSNRRADPERQVAPRAESRLGDQARASNVVSDKPRGAIEQPGAARGAASPAVPAVPQSDALGIAITAESAGARDFSGEKSIAVLERSDLAGRVSGAAAPSPAAAVATLGRTAADREAANALGVIADESLHEAKRRGLERNRMAASTSEVAAGVESERYEAVVENRPAAARDQPLSTFSIDVDTASYANVRRFLEGGRLPPRDAVRIEELVNYFRYDYPQPGGDDPFSVTVDAAECPWQAGRRLIRIGLQGREIDRRERPAGNLVFLVDVSGSMAAANKLPLVKQALAMLVDELTGNDSVAIVTYAGDAGLKLPPTGGDQKEKILAAIGSLTAGGATHGSAGIALAYEQAAEGFIPGGANRVILATDGDLNVGVTSDEALVELIGRKAAGGTFLTVLGFGDGNLQDAKMEKLADNGNGVYAYVDGAREARKVLVEQLTGSTITIAKDVKIQVEFNPVQVVSYRLLGYENRIMAHADFRNDRKDAGEIGAGHSVTALYEVTLAADVEGSAAGAEPLRYQPRPQPAPVVANETSRELLTVKLRWKRPDGDESLLREVPLADAGGDFSRAPADLRFAGAVAAFGMIMRGSDQRGQATLPLVATIAGSSLGRDEGGYRAEFLDLVRRAESLGRREQGR